MEPGWRPVTACSLPVLHRNEAWTVTRICPSSSLPRRPGNRGEAVLKAPPRRDPGGRTEAGGQGVASGRDPVPCLRTHAQSPSSKLPTRDSPQSRAQQRDRRNSLQAGSLQGFLNSRHTRDEGATFLWLCCWLSIGVLELLRQVAGGW